MIEAEALARRLSPYRMGAQQDVQRRGPAVANPGMLELLGIPGDPMTFDVQQAWRPRPVRDRYRVPFGIGENGQLVELDIKEAAMEGMGPHGLCVGATGSGKSEFLRTLVLAMLSMHSSSTLNMILVDFKGGATFHGFDQAPHVAANITNLAGDLTLVDRMKDAIAGEVNRRQEAAGQAQRQERLGLREDARERRRSRPAARTVHLHRRVLRDAGRRSPTSSTSSCRSAASAGRCRCTCCLPRSASKRASCAAWTPTCPTGSV